MHEIVIDTSVIFSGLYSSLGYSYKLISLIGQGKFNLNVSVPLIIEYEKVLIEKRNDLKLSVKEVGEFLDYICSVSSHRRIHFLWRPRLKDPGDDMVLELAVEAECDFIVTFNLRDFTDAAQFGIRAINPRNYLEELGGMP